MRGMDVLIDIVMKIVIRIAHHILIIWRRFRCKCWYRLSLILLIMNKSAMLCFTASLLAKLYSILPMIIFARKCSKLLWFRNILSIVSHSNIVWWRTRNMSLVTLFRWHRSISCHWRYRIRKCWFDRLDISWCIFQKWIQNRLVFHKEP